MCVYVCVCGWRAQANPGRLDKMLEHWLPLVLFAVDAGTMLVEVAQLGKFAFSESTPVSLQPVKGTLEVTTSFGLPALDYGQVQVATHVLIWLFVLLMSSADRLQLQAARRPNVRRPGTRGARTRTRVR